MIVFDILSNVQLYADGKKTVVGGNIYCSFVFLHAGTDISEVVAVDAIVRGLVGQIGIFQLIVEKMVALAQKKPYDPFALGKSSVGRKSAVQRIPNNDVEIRQGNIQFRDNLDIKTEIVFYVCCGFPIITVTTKVFSSSLYSQL